MKYPALHHYPDDQTKQPRKSDADLIYYPSKQPRKSDPDLIYSPSRQPRISEPDFVAHVYLDLPTPSWGKFAKPAQTMEEFLNER
jgi:hypothetical protein